MAREAMSEMLKFGFNVLCFYPRVHFLSSPTLLWSFKDSCRSSVSKNQEATGIVPTHKAHGLANLKGMFPAVRWGSFLTSYVHSILPSLLRTFNSLPPTFPSPITPPMTQLIHNLIMVPVSAPLHQKWFPQSAPLSSHVSQTSKPSSTTSSPVSKESPTLSPTSASDSLPKEGKTGKIDRALSMLSGRSRPPRSPSPNPPSPPDTLLHTYNILDITLAYYLPDALDPDDASAREKCKREDTTLDELVTPLVLLVTRLCIGDETSRARLRGWLIPPSLDRTSPLEAHSDTLGRCLRLLGSVYHTNLKKAVGEMLYAMCDSDGKYGNSRTMLMLTPIRWMNSFYPRISGGLWKCRGLFIQ